MKTLCPNVTGEQILIRTCTWHAESPGDVGTTKEERKGKSLCKELVQAWCCCSSLDASACREVLLSWRSAIEAARLAPTEQARSLAVLETIVCSDGIALGAIGVDADLSLHACVELVVVDASQAQRSSAALVALVAKRVGIETLDHSLLIGRALHGGCRFEARGCSSSFNASACREVLLSWCSAIEAARLAPTEQARSLAVLEAIVCCGGIALGAIGVDADLSFHACVELVVVDASQAQSTSAALVALVAESVGIESLDHSLLVGRALHGGCRFEAGGCCSSLDASACRE